MKITIEQLREELEKKLQAISCLNKFYIGETDKANWQKTVNRHEKEGYTTTTPLAEGEHETISKAEEFLLNYFQDSLLKDKMGNKIPYSVGSDKADTLYVSICINPQHVNELYDDDIDWPNAYQLI